MELAAWTARLEEIEPVRLEAVEAVEAVEAGRRAGGQALGILL